VIVNARRWRYTKWDVEADQDAPSDAAQVPAQIGLQNDGDIGRAMSLQIAVTRAAQVDSQSGRHVKSLRHASRGVNDPIDSGAGPPRARGTGVVSHHGLLSITDAVAF
jgi:hypothetical protein